jgi:DNA-binding transcriptional LysR family regulator
MVRDFAKLETFLVVVKEKSFSKASAKLGISQPAVTQQIKFLEEYLDTKIIERKKNGIKLTKEGEKLLAIVQKLDRCIGNAEKELVKIINKDIAFNIGSSFTIGNYVLPHILNDLKDAIKNEVFVQLALSEDVIDKLLDKKVDLAAIESPVFRDNVIYREWLEDELVLFSKTPLPKTVKKEDLFNFKWVCREWGSHTRRTVNETFEEIGVDCNTFDIISVVTSSTAVKQTILKSQIDKEHPTVAIISRAVLTDELEKNILFESKVRNLKIRRKLYLGYLKDRKNDAYIENIVNYLMGMRSINF